MGKKKILVIDDDILILNSIKKQLKDSDFIADFTDDPLKGLKMIENDNYDLVLSDIKMKPILGLELLERIKKNFPYLPVVIITGYIDDKIMSQAKELGCADYLVKPVRKQDLLDCLSNVLQNNLKF